MRAEIHLHAYEMCLLSIRINNLFLCSHGKKHVLPIECNDKLSENYTNGIQFRFCPYNILGVTDRSINCHMALSAMNYLYNILSSFANLLKIQKCHFRLWKFNDTVILPRKDNHILQYWFHAPFLKLIYLLFCFNSRRWKIWKNA